MSPSPAIHYRLLRCVYSRFQRRVLPKWRKGDSLACDLIKIQYPPRLRFPLPSFVLLLRLSFEVPFYFPFPVRPFITPHQSSSRICSLAVSMLVDIKESLNSVKKIEAKQRVRTPWTIFLPAPYSAFRFERRGQQSLKTVWPSMHDALSQILDLQHGAL